MAQTSFARNDDVFGRTAASSTLTSATSDTVSWPHFDDYKMQSAAAFPYQYWAAATTQRTPAHCAYCKSEYHDSKAHPGTCGNCGAPKQDA